MEKPYPAAACLLAGLAYCWKAESAAENLGASVEYLELDFPNRQRLENLAESAECHPALLPHFPNHLHWKAWQSLWNIRSGHLPQVVLIFTHGFRPPFLKGYKNRLLYFPGNSFRESISSPFQNMKSQPFCESRSTPPVLLNSLDAYNLIRNIFAECRIVLDKQHCRFLFHKQFFNLHSGKMSM